MTNKKRFIWTLSLLYAIILSVCIILDCYSVPFDLTLAGFLNFLSVCGYWLLPALGIVIILLLFYRVAIWFEEKPIDPNKKLPFEEGFVYVRLLQ